MIYARTPLKKGACYIYTGEVINDSKSEKSKTEK